jgi:GntR family transcriptional repressor for pyruvate dehydrogenase complex
MAANQLSPLEPFLTEPRPDLSQQLTRQLLTLIDARNLQPGDRLPSMKELAAIFSVATPTIREAVRRLQATGVVDIRHGSGIYVRKVAQGLVIPNPHVGELNAESLLQLLEARLAMEPYLAGRAAELATPADIAALKDILDSAEQLLDGHDAQLHPINLRFHGRIARISRNTILADFLESLFTLHAQEQRGILEIFNARAQDYRDHIHIFAAISEGDSARATQCMTDHLINVRDVIAERISNASR